MPHESAFFPRSPRPKLAAYPQDAEFEWLLCLSSALQSGQLREERGDAQRPSSAIPPMEGEIC